MSSIRERMKEKKRIVVKIGSSSLMHDNTGKLNLLKIEKLVIINTKKKSKPLFGKYIIPMAELMVTEPFMHIFVVKDTI